MKEGRRHALRQRAGAVPAEAAVLEGEREAREGGGEPRRQRLGPRVAWTPPSNVLKAN